MGRAIVVPGGHMAELDAGTLPPNTELDCDICIIGSGAAGITLAHRLLSTGKKILVLESSLVDKREAIAAAKREAVQQHESTSAPPAREALYRAAREVSADASADGHRYEDPDTQPLYRGDVTSEMRAID